MVDFGCVGQISLGLFVGRSCLLRKLFVYHEQPLGDGAVSGFVPVLKRKVFMNERSRDSKAWFGNPPLKKRKHAESNWEKDEDSAVSNLLVVLMCRLMCGLDVCPRKLGKMNPLF